MNYQKDRPYYEDLYDLSTIKSCLLSQSTTKKILEEKTKIGKRDMKISVDGMTNFLLYFKKGERYKNRDTTIQKWIDKDRMLDEKLVNAIFPLDIRCSKCDGLLEEESRHLKDTLQSNPIVEFISFCKTCTKGEILYENGQKYIPDDPLCPKCGSKLKTSSKYSDDKSTHTKKCTKCNYKNASIYDFKNSEKERDTKEKQDKELLSKYRSQFCISETEGSEYIQQMENIKRLTEMMKESEAKNKDPEYQKARAVKKLTVTELQKLLSKKFKEEGYINLNFENPEIDRYVIVPFTVQNSKKSRNKEKSSKDLNRILKLTLDNLNWKLMSDGLEYRMGYLKGRFKGYEREDELAKFIKKRDNKEKYSYIDPDGSKIIL